MTSDSVKSCILEHNGVHFTHHFAAPAHLQLTQKIILMLFVSREPHCHCKSSYCKMSAIILGSDTSMTENSILQSVANLFITIQNKCQKNWISSWDLKLVGLEEWCQRETMEIVLYDNSRSLELGLSFPIFHSLPVFLLQSSSPFVSKVYIKIKFKM